jgi:AP-1 complex subunit gamma-1
VGYLGLTQLLDENTEILMLVTNSIKNDMNNVNQYISGMAMCALGNIGNQEMCLALSREVQNQMSTENPLIRKKAALCAMRIIKKVEDVEDRFNTRLTALLEDKNHGVILSACTLLIHLLETHPKEHMQEFKHCAPLLIKTLKSMLLSGYANAAEYDFSGIVDPFIQVKILKVLRLFARDPSIVSADELNDILAQIATNTDGSKNAGNAVLYECVQTIMSIPNADSGLRVLGINILGKFLTNKDANIKYVALSMLHKVVQVDPKSVQRHRAIVMECLRDSDLAIRRQALEVSFSLINHENVKALAKELIQFLITAEPDFKNDLASRICVAIDRFAPDKRWLIDNTIKVLLLAGNHVSDQVAFALCHVIAGAPELHSYSVHKLFYTLSDPDFVQADPCTLVATWIIGEYGHLLAAPVTVSDVLDLFDEVLRRALAIAADQAVAAATKTTQSLIKTSVVAEYVVTAAVKLLVKSRQMGTPTNRSRVEQMLHRFDGSLSADLQQRVCEFLVILSSAWDDETRAGLLDVVPPCEHSTSATNKPIGEEINVQDAVPANATDILNHVRGIAKNNGQKPSQPKRRIVKQTPAAGAKPAGGGFDLDDLLGEATVIPTQTQQAPKVSDDLLNDLFG